MDVPPITLNDIPARTDVLVLFGETLVAILIQSTTLQAIMHQTADVFILILSM
jgi:hypothetical protein